MKKTITLVDFERAFEDYGREDQFSREGLQELFFSLEEFEEETGTEVELDVIGFCVEFTEYDSLEEFQDVYGEEYKSLDDIREVTMVFEIEKTGGFIIQNF